MTDASQDSNPFSRRRQSASTGAVPDSPISLFEHLRPVAIKQLWEGQRQALMDYANHQSSATDLAVQLPTGDGKTLVGLLVAEYRRRLGQSRAIYLCPTRQLCKQVESLAQSYSIGTAMLLRNDVNGDYVGLNDYNQGRSIGISTYQGLFNVSPAFLPPSTIIADDIHVGSEAIADHWSVRVERAIDPGLYRQVIALFSNDIGSSATYDLTTDDASEVTYGSVTHVPGSRLIDRSSSLTSLLMTWLESRPASNWRFTWSMVQDHLPSCSVYLSRREILIRPNIPPILEHTHVNSASQRVFMSATIGESGELARSIGIQPQVLVPVSESSLPKTPGRRLFLFPDLGETSVDQTQLLAESIKIAGRGLVISPTMDGAQKLTLSLSDSLAVVPDSTFEQDPESFTSREGVALVLANRYDGIDLAGDKCRLVAQVGLPTGVNNMERFLVERANLRSLFAARTRTRIVQGAGRCCRGADDYAVVMMQGQTLLDFCQEPEILETFPVTIQAEIRIGLELSDGKSNAEFLALVQEFILQSENWKSLTHEIEGEAEASRQVVSTTAVVLHEIVQNELAFSRHMWSGRYADASLSAIAIRDHLARYVDLKFLQAWWEYQTACAYWAEGVASNTLQNIELSHRYVDQAGTTWRHGWLATARRHFTRTEAGQTPADPVAEFDASAAEKVLEWLRNQGNRSRKFDSTLSDFDLLIRSESHEDFERGIEILGSMLGFSSRRYTESAPPDSIWWLADVLLTFEAKNEASTESLVSANTVRQANAQPRWAASRLERPFERKFAIVVSPHEFLADDARMVVGDEKFATVAELIALAEDTSSCLRLIRSELPDIGDDGAISVVQSRLANSGLTATVIVERLTSKGIGDLPRRSRN